MAPDEPPSRRRLPRGAHALGRDDVARIHRARLRQGVVDAVDERGYLGTRISDVTRHADVGRNAFYAQFPSKEASFIATRERIIDTARAGLVEALDALPPAAPAAEVVGCAIATLTGAAAAHPQETRLLLTEVLAIGPHGPAHRRTTRHEVQELVAERLAAAKGPKLTPLALGAVVGGLLHVIATSLQHRTTHELPGLAEDLTAWALSYAQATPARASSPRPAATRAPKRSAAHRPPAGRRPLPHSFVARSQRERMIDAVIGLTAAHGYVGLTLPEIATTAGVSHQTFYEHFANKQAVFVAATDDAQAQLLAAAENAFNATKPWPAAVRAGIQAWTEFLAAEPAIAKFCFNDMLSGGSEAGEHIDAAQRGFASLLQPGYEQSAAVPAITTTAVVGALWTVVEDQVAENATDRLPDLTGDLTVLALAPFVGAKRAQSAATPKG